MTGEKNNALAGPLAQSIDIGFRAARFAIASLALGWATMNVREVPPDMQAVVMRLGAVDRAQQAGLVVARPRPFERVLLMPGPAQQMTQHIEADASAALGLDEVVSKSEAPKSAHGYLTGDGGVGLIDTPLTWRVVDAGAYVLAEPHIVPALRRLAEGAATAIAAARPLDDFVVARPEAADPPAQAAREALRAAYAAEVNRRLAALERRRPWDRGHARGLVGVLAGRGEGRVRPGADCRPDGRADDRAGAHRGGRGASARRSGKRSNPVRSAVRGVRERGASACADGGGRESGGECRTRRPPGNHRADLPPADGRDPP